MSIITKQLTSLIMGRFRTNELLAEPRSHAGHSQILSCSCGRKICSQQQNLFTAIKSVHSDKIWEWPGNEATPSLVAGSSQEKWRGMRLEAHQFWGSRILRTIEPPQLVQCTTHLASFPGHSQILSHSCEIKWSDL